MISITKKLLADIEESFNHGLAQKGKTKPCRIKFNGKFITTLSGKTVWRNITFAKSALLNHFRSAIEIQVDNYYTDYKQIIEELEKTGIIQYVEDNI
jgi:hypothetical protein